jgi:hypothetical protein
MQLKSPELQTSEFDSFGVLGWRTVNLRIAKTELDSPSLQVARAGQPLKALHLCRLPRREVLYTPRLLRIGIAERRAHVRHGLWPEHGPTRPHEAQSKAR